MPCKFPANSHSFLAYDFRLHKAWKKRENGIATLLLELLPRLVYLLEEGKKILPVCIVQGIPGVIGKRVFIFGFLRGHRVIDLSDIGFIAKKLQCNRLWRRVAVTAVRVIDLAWRSATLFPHQRGGGFPCPC